MAETYVVVVVKERWESDFWQQIRTLEDTKLKVGTVQ